MNDERMQILTRVETGEISAEEAVRQLNALGQAPTDAVEPDTFQPEPETAAAEAWAAGADAFICKGEPAGKLLTTLMTVATGDGQAPVAQRSI